MSYSRRELYALGEPLGDSITRKEGGKIIYGDGGGSSQPSTQTQITELPEWARGKAQNVLNLGEALTDINKNPYQKFTGERIAGFQPLQEKAFETAGSIAPASQLGTATGLAGTAGARALDTSYQPGRFYGGQFGQRQAAQYMSPYIEEAMQPQLREAQRASDIQAQQQRAQAVGAGAFGGSRQAIAEAERLRNLGQQQADIRAKGYQTAYEQAANQYNQDMARRMQAQQLGEQSRQYGAGLGLQGLQTALQGAGQLGQLGQTQYGQQMGITQLQSALGAQQQQQAQRPLDVAYQDFLNQQNYPYKQLGFMSDLIRGMPLGQRSTTTMYEAPGSTLGQVGGIGMGLYGLSKMGLGFADGGSVTSAGNVNSILGKLSDQQLQQAREAALNRRDLEQVQMIDAEIAERSAARRGIAPALSEDFADSLEQGMATGGIVAFADRGQVVDTDQSDYFQDPMGTPSSVGGRELSVSDFIPDLRQTVRQGEEYSPGLRGMLFGYDVKPPAEKPKAVAEKPKAANAPVINVPPKSAPAAKAAPKPSGGIADAMPTRKEVKSAVSQLAEQNKLNPDVKDDLVDSTMKIVDELGKRNQPILDELRKSIEEQKPDTAAMKEKGLGQALAAFGFGMAQQASKRGREGYGGGLAGLIGSAAAASPVIAEVAAKTDQLIQNRQDNYSKLKLDQAKYEVALAKGDMQTAASLAGQIRAGQQADKLLQFHIANAQDNLALEKQKLAQQAAYQQGTLSRYETVGSLTRDIMANEGIPYDKALEKAARLLKPAGYAADVRAEVAQNANLDKALEKLNANQKYMMLPYMKPDNPKYAPLKAEYEAEKRAIYQRHGGGQAVAPAAPSQVIRFNERGEMIQ